ncbi:MAG: trypsin-like peptidase domain-containing protein [Verrucomicrobiota bacterium]
MNTFKKYLGGMLVAGLTLSNSSLWAKETNSSALNMARQLNQAFIEVAEQVSPAVVVIEVTQKASAPNSESDADNPFWDMFPPELRRRFQDRNNNNGGQRGDQPSRPRKQPRSTGRGSGIVVTEDGYILTNNHVVEDAETITVRFKDSRTFKATVKGLDPQSDLAVIKIDAKGLVPAKMGDSSATRVGEFAIAVGAPFLWEYSVTIGHISGKGRSIPNQPKMDQDFLQTDASINPGNSGGPLVNLYGEVIGINSMIYGMNTGIGFAIPSNLAKQVMSHLIQDGKFTRSRIGVGIEDLRKSQDFKTWVPNLEDGVVIVMIQSDGPAAKSELKVGDIVTAVDGTPVKTSRELKEEIAYKKPGQAVTLDAARVDAAGKMKSLKIKVKTDALPDENETASNNRSGNSPAEPTNFGLTVRPLTKELADEYGIKSTTGLLVTAVEDGSPAQESRIKAGDIITEVNRAPVSNMKQFREALNGVDPKKGVIINFVSKGTSRFTVLKDE